MGRGETAVNKGCRLGVMLGGLKLVEDERVNRKLPLTTSGNTEVLGAVVNAISPIGRSLWRLLRCLLPLNKLNRWILNVVTFLFVSLTKACSFLFNV